jgi:hypothetical protein
MRSLTLLLLVAVSAAGFAQTAMPQKSSASELIALARTKNADLASAISANFDAKDLKEGTAWSGHGADFFFATEADVKPELLIDDAPGPAMRSVANTHLWYASARIDALGKLHAFYYMVNGTRFGGKLDVPAFTSLSYLQAGVPS